MMKRLLTGDCMDLMKDIPDASVNLVLCDPPYGTTLNDWDKVLPFESLWAEYKRLLADGGCVVLFGSQPFSSALVMSNPKWFKYELVWDKNKCGSPGLAKVRPMKTHENILVFAPGKTLYNPQMEKGEPYKRKTDKPDGYVGRCNNHRYGLKPVTEFENHGTRYPKSVLRISRDFSAQQQVHPCLPAGEKVFFNGLWMPIEDVRVGFTNNYGKVVGITTHEAENLVEITSGGDSVVATWNHPFLVKRENTAYWVNADQVSPSDILLSTVSAYNVQKPYFKVTRLWQRGIRQQKGTLGLVMGPPENLGWSTVSCGKATMVRFLLGCSYITKTVTRKTTALPIYSLSAPLSTKGCTRVAELSTGFGRNLAVFVGCIRSVMRRIGIFPEGGLTERSVNCATPNAHWKHEKFYLRKVGNVRTIHEKTRVYNLTVAGAPVFDSLIGLTHNTQKPVPLMEWLVKTYSNVGDTVLDNAMGSGSTGIAALRLGRRFIGIEKDAVMAVIARSRIHGETRADTHGL